MTSPPAPGPIETISRLVDNENFRQPAVGSYKLYYTATAPCAFGLDACNRGTTDAHISVYIIDPSITAWVDGSITNLPDYSAVVYKLRLEADATDGSLWTMPVKNLNDGDRVIVWSDTGQVTWFGHGFLFTVAT